MMRNGTGWLQGSGAQIQEDFGVPNLVQFPITEDLSAAGDGGQPLVVANPTGPVAGAYSDLGAAVVREIAKLSRSAKNSVRFDEELRAFVVRLPSQDAAASGAFLCIGAAYPSLRIRVTGSAKLRGVSRAIEQNIVHENDILRTESVTLIEEGVHHLTTCMCPYTTRPLATSALFLPGADASVRKTPSPLPPPPLPPPASESHSQPFIGRVC